MHMRAWAGGALFAVRVVCRWVGIYCAISFGRYSVGSLFFLAVRQKRLQSLRAARECNLLRVADFSAAADLGVSLRFALRPLELYFGDVTGGATEIIRG